MTEREKKLEGYTIYHLYAERHMGEYGTTDFGYFSNKKDALETRQKEWERIKKDPSNTEHCKMDGYYKDDWYIDEIKVAGYTKTHFPIEKLEEWLKYKENKEKLCAIKIEETKELALIRSITFDEVLNKIIHFSFFLPFS